MKLEIRSPQAMAQAIARAGYTPGGLARVMDTNASHLRLVLRGVKNPSPAYAKRIAEAIDADFDELFVAKMTV